MQLSGDLKEFIASLNSAKVEYLIVGAWSFAFYARPRYTGDLDVFVNPTPTNAESILRALEDFGFGDIGLSTKDFTESGQVIQLGVAPNRVDLFTSLTGVEFAEAWAEHAAGKIDGIDVSFLSRQHLIKNKLAVGRPQDLTDVELLQREETK
jgi:hypothetical protein